MSITENSRLRGGLRFKRGDYDTRYATVVEAVPIKTADGAVMYRDGQPICYLASCDGHYLRVADRIAHLLSRYGWEDDE